MKEKEINEIITKIQNGERELLADFIKDNMNIIYSKIEQYKGVFEEYEDLVQVGIEAFIKAVDSYDFSGYFITRYAAIRIHTATKLYIFANLDRITDEQKRYEIVKYYYETCRKYIGRELEYSDISKYYGVEVSYAKQLVNIYKMGNIYCDFEENKDYYEDYTLDDIERQVSSENFSNYLKNTPLLSKRQKELVLYRYGFIDGKEHTLAEMAEKNNSTTQTMNSRDRHAIKKLRRVIKR